MAPKRGCGKTCGWVGDVTLKERFPRLYKVSNQKNSVISDCVKDQIACTFSEDGQYSTKSFADAVTRLEYGNPAMKHIFDNVWCGVVPPMVEMLLWFFMTGD
ncbi:hypothetical protein PIB30_041601 [Stylosanthes scabra]|uniref:Uncharacterized protein n=1 Tax=Stylosanthes scabra TaxID=79078 RepID=A0ABU6VG34_9FABA|nr:hypothetical protein [Stylosanthes scabra]